MKTLDVDLQRPKFRAIFRYHRDASNAELLAMHMQFDKFDIDEFQAKPQLAVSTVLSSRLVRSAADDGMEVEEDGCPSSAPWRNRSYWRIR